MIKHSSYLGKIFVNLNQIHNLLFFNVLKVTSSPSKKQNNYHLSISFSDLKDREQF